VSVEFRGENEYPRLHVQSLHQADAWVRLTATAFSDSGQTLIELGEVILPAGTHSVVPLDIAKLRLPARAAVWGGRVTFTASASFVDGKRDGNDTGAVYYALGPTGLPVLSSRPNVGLQHLRGVSRKVRQGARGFARRGA
jgi:hypothetical protein